MSDKGLIEIGTDIDERFPDNTAGLISPMDIRDELHDIKDSFVNKTDEHSHLRMTPYDPAIEYKTGQACSSNGVTIYANKNTTGTFKLTDWQLEPPLIQIDISGIASIDLTGIELARNILLFSDNATESINEITNGKIGMVYRFYAIDGLDVTFEREPIATASTGQIVLTQGTDLGIKGSNGEGDWIELSMKGVKGIYFEQASKIYT